MPSKFLKIKIQIQVLQLEQDNQTRCAAVCQDLELHTSTIQSPLLLASSHMFQVTLCIRPLRILQNQTITQTINSALRNRHVKQIARDAWPTSTSRTYFVSFHSFALNVKQIPRVVAQISNQKTCFLISTSRATPY